MTETRTTRTLELVDAIMAGLAAVDDGNFDTRDVCAALLEVMTTFVADLPPAQREWLVEALITSFPKIRIHVESLVLDAACNSHEAGHA
jgi:hypothetical protein